MTPTNGAARIVAPAKVNLTLRLLGLREDGYHLLESLVVFTQFGDTLVAAPSDVLELAVDGPFAVGVPTDDRNLVLKAAHLLRTLRGVKDGASLHLTKHLPHGAGIGGGSSDAAAAIKLLANLWGVTPLTPQEALALGADVPVCLCAPTATVMRGIGEDLTPAPHQPVGWLVLINPGVTVPTGSVFKLHEKLYPFSPTLHAPMDELSSHEAFNDWLARECNDLTKVACGPSIAPIIQDVLEALHPWTTASDMSGSGSTCWGLFQDEETAQRCAQAVLTDHPDWWVVATPISS